MYTVWVQVDVHAARLDDFLAAIHANSRASLADEPGCIRFDVHRDAADPCRFYFYEIYADQDAFEVGHRTAPHYDRWREAEAECVVPGSKSVLLGHPVFPGDIPEAAST